MGSSSLYEEFHLYNKNNNKDKGLFLRNQKWNPGRQQIFLMSCFETNLNFDLSTILHIFWKVRI